MAWLYVIAAGLIEVAFALSLQRSEGFSKLWPTVFALGAAAVSLYLLSTALRVLPVGTAYAVWVGIGAAGTAAVGIALLGEPLTAPRLGSLALILVGVIGLRLAEGR